MIPTKTYPLSAIMGKEIEKEYERGYAQGCEEGKERIAELEAELMMRREQAEGLQNQWVKDTQKIVALEAEVMEFKSRGNVAMSSWDEERERALREGERVVALEAEVKMLRKDAERYWCLRDNCDFAITQNIGHDWINLIFADEVDAAIDAAAEAAEVVTEQQSKVKK